MIDRRAGLRAAESHLAANRLMSARETYLAVVEAYGPDAATEALGRQIEARIARAQGDLYQQSFDEARRFEEEGDHRSAADAYRRAAEAASEPVAAARAYTNLASQLNRLADLDGAVAACEAGLSLAPDYPPLLYNFGVILQARGETGRAIEAYEHAVGAHPDWAQAWYNLGTAYQKAERLNEAVTAYRNAVAAKPDYAMAENNMGNVLRDLGRFAEAVEALDRALALRPDHPNARFNRGLAYLSMGDYERGWSDYATRFRDASIRRISGFRDYGLPRWRGEDITGKRLLVLSEQGAGDTIQFARFLTMINDRAVRIVLECPPGLLPLLNDFPAVDAVVPRAKDATLQTPADLFVPLLDLPMILGTSLETVPADIPYIAAPSGRLERMEKLIGDAGFRVGVVWSGNPRNKINRRRSMNLQTLAPLAEIGSLRLFSLQKGPAAAQCAEAGFPIEDLGPHLRDYGDTAAAIASLDLVVSVCTSVAHLAGAMGAPAFTLLHRVPDWRWLPRAEESPWYPGMQLFYQTTAGDWGPVVERVKAAIEARLA